MKKFLREVKINIYFCFIKLNKSKPNKLVKHDNL